MSTAKWALLDYGKTAHWWLGNEGTACGRDFRVDLRVAYSDDPRCRKCRAALTTTHPAETLPTEEGR
mgnify:CR=1 FL=1